MAERIQAEKITLREVQNQSFDYIVVGGGTSGCLIAQRIASHVSQPRVLVVEAGREDAEDPDNLVPGLTKPKFGSADGNWLYESTPQKNLNGRVVTYPRGKGMGGSSSNNFMAWVAGPATDWDDWAEAVGDDWWSWKNAQREIKKLENFRSEVPTGGERFAKPTPGAHGKGGPIAVGYGKQWQPIIKHTLSAALESGHKVNADNNDGDPIGVSVAQFNVDNGTRVTSATAFLGPSLRTKYSNLVVLTQTLCSKVLFHGRTATGVELLPSMDSTTNVPVTVKCRREVILTAGAFQSAQLLLLSGIGPAADLESLNIPVIHNLPAVGGNMQDHTALACEFIIKKDIPGHNQLLNDPVALNAALKEYKQTQSGPLAMFGASAVIIFPVLEKLLASPRFQNLPQETKSFLTKAGRPSTELWIHGGPLFYTGPCPPDASVIVLEGLCQNNLSKGTMKLASTNPRTLPKIDINYISNEYDLQVAIETVREILRLAKTTALSSIIESVLLAPGISKPESPMSSVRDDDTAIERFVRETLTQGFHAMSTCLMGRKEDSNKVVTNDFKVDGVSGLRVADMSVCPILTCNHTQINAYLIGERCSMLILQDLDRQHASRSTPRSKL